MDRRQAPSVACLRCRKQKLRCGRERPACERCTNLKSECVYPAPPDRKRLAFERAQAKIAETQHKEAGHPAQLTYGNSLPQHTTSSTSLPQHTTSSTTLPQHTTSSTTLPQYTTSSPSLPQHTTSSPSAEYLRRLQRNGPTTPAENLCIEVSTEVAVFLIEIYFERHYQADLLFCKKGFIQSYNAGLISNTVIEAMFAFASVFLSPMIGGITSGKIDIGEISQADWRSIGSRWAENAGQQALMHADKPSLELVQACQILALYWFAKAETTRTNMHTSIAYRACRLMHLHQIRGKISVLDWSAEREQGMRCFWACWLTKCASQENSRFHVDCWTDALGCPLPSNGPDGFPTMPTWCLGKKGLLQELDSTQRNSSIEFNASLIIIQGFWWEVQEFVQTIHATSNGPTEQASKFCSLSRRLEEIPDQITEFIQYHVDHEPLRFSSADQGRLFSLAYLYHLCVVYLHSSMVPVLSCSPQSSAFSRSMIRLAAEQAWEHSVSMTTMTERFVAREAATSKLWAVVGYGAYVCAAIQLRRLLAVGDLTEQRLKDAKVHLHLTGELSKHWMTLQPLYDNMKRQFAQAETLISSQEVNPTQENGTQHGQLTRLMVPPESGASPELSSHLRSYVANDDMQNQAEQQQNSNVTIIGSEGHDTSPASNLTQASDDPSLAQTIRLTSPGEREPTMWEASTEGPRGEAAFQPNWASRDDGVWWSQDPESLGDVFGSGFFLRDDTGFRMDIY